MIIRNLKQDEYTKSHKVISSAYSFKWTEEDEKKIFVPEYCFGAFDDNDTTLMSVMYSVSLGASYFGKFIPCAGAGMVATLPMYRRQGCVRKMFDAVFERMRENGEIFSFIYPFSYDYYRKFGYEQISEKYLLSFPMSSLGCVVQNCGGVLLDNSADFEKLKKVYTEYALTVQAAFDRSEAMWEKKLTTDPYGGGLHTYLWYNEKGEEKGYVTLTLENGTLTVWDMAYIGNEGLRGILGFLRVFSGRADKVTFRNVSRDCPLRYIIKEYSASCGSLSSWFMARVTDVKAAFENAVYPEKKGHFSVKVNDTLEYNNKIFDVEYGSGKCNVTCRNDGNYDLETDIPLLTRILLGSDTFTPEIISYCDNAEVCGDVSDMIEVFGRKEIYLNDSAI